ncbi:hypothetical protein M3I54_43465 [Paraburkholderia sp. CNPSo 3274]|uniref:hypothetical protein n=1 Tax=Paraburkholderia sp. CNPSo 3274 TaxID=2940932 RepID=UPI0020B772E2|nr:hypothetical protein [Paraburkholderia sp. CNPSo 3274]MCP3713613.1 hypothetical protein [Paraburkholderia sp. CNPSo 3274]
MEEMSNLHTDLAAAHGIQQPYRRAPGAVSWAAIVAGAVAMAAFSLILLMLGTGLGLSSLSPWPGSGAHAKTFGFAAIVWICVTQVMSAGLGGYLAGRLRRHWPDVSADETHFRDTAHGFIAWSLATLFSAAVLASAITGIAREGVRAVATGDMAEPGVQAASGVGTLARGDGAAAYRTWPMGYLIDGMLRPPAGAISPDNQEADDASVRVEQKQEIARIFLNGLPGAGGLAPDDSDYVARIVARRTGLAPADARARVLSTWSRLQEKAGQLNNAARAAADEARKATIHITLWLFVSLLIGAFAASLMATIGGRMREF